MKVIVITAKSWNIENAIKLKERFAGEHQITILTEKEDVALGKLEEYQPDYIFFPHWSYIIPQEVYETFECVVFHMTDLPYGRGGSPLQNLIIREKKETKISAIRVVKELDAGPIYFKENLSLEGSAEEIFERASDIIFSQMIPIFFERKVMPKEQEGEPVLFTRRKPFESEIPQEATQRKIYDYIRMLDAEGYPHAFIKYGENILEFTNAEIVDGALRANVMFRRNEHE